MYLKRYDEDLIYKLRNVAIVEYSASVNPEIIPIPNLDDVLAFNLGGRRNRIVVRFSMIESDYDLSMGTYVSEIKSIPEQIDYLRSYFISADVSIELGVVFEVSDGFGETVEYKGIPIRLSWAWRGGEKKVDVTLELLTVINY